MKINNIFIIAATFAGLVLLSIAYYELTIDWEIFSDITLGLYLSLSYLMLNIFYIGPRELTNKL